MSKHRGFIYQTEAGEWVLATEPDLKSCCLGKEGQIILDGEFFQCSAHQAYTVKGCLQGERLLQAELVERGGFPLYTILFLLLFLGFFKKFIKS